MSNDVHLRGSKIDRTERQSTETLRNAKKSSILGSAHEQRDTAHRARDRRPAEELLQHPAGPAETSAPAAESGDEGAHRPRGAGADLPEGDHPPRGESEPPRTDPRGAARGLHPPRPPDSALPRDSPGGVPEDAGAGLLQARGPQPRRLAQTEHPPRPG